MVQNKVARLYGPWLYIIQPTRSSDAFCPPYITVLYGSCRLLLLMGGVRSIVLSAFVCVCFLICLENHVAKLQIFCALPVAGLDPPRAALPYVIYIYISGFVNDVMFSYSWFYGVSCVFLYGESITAKTTALFSAKFCSTIKITKCSSFRCHWGRSPLYTIVFCRLG